MGKLGPTLALFILSAMAVACSTTARAPGQTTTTLPAAGDRQVVVTEPSAGARSPVVITEPSARGQVAAQPSAAVGGQVNHKVTGRVTDINRNSGQITIRTPEGGSLKLVLPPLAVASVREGDDVAVDVLVNPARR